MTTTDTRKQAEMRTLEHAAKRLALVAANTTADLIGFDGAEELDEAIDHVKRLLMPETNHGWEVLVLVDADNHLNIYITNTNSSDIYECDTGQGDRGSGEELALRYTTDVIEKAAEDDSNFYYDSDFDDSFDNDDN
jgi:hypothetical protein